MITVRESAGGSTNIRICLHGAIDNTGKMSSIENLKSKSMILESDEKVLIIDQLKRLGVEHLFDKIEPVIYSDNY